jgi:EAL domain-containing protein (putative c-di-GMP-specific phosphodiesterase class I)
MGCDFAQGYHFSRPAPSELIDGLLAADVEPRARKPGIQKQLRHAQSA